jgi:hypothetical protein
MINVNAPWFENNWERVACYFAQRESPIVVIQTWGT